MPRATGSNPSRKHDGRKRWHRSRASLQDRDDSQSTQPTEASQTAFINERIIAIPSLDLEALPSVIDEARLEENVAVQPTVVEACLQRILHHTTPGSPLTPCPEQVRLETLKAIHCCHSHGIRKEYRFPRLFYLDRQN